MEVFLEQLVKHKKKTSDHIKAAALTFGAVLLTFVLFILNIMFRKYLFGMGLLIIAGLWYGYYLLIQNFNIEYEYILTNSEMDIDKVIAKKGRKNVVSVDFREIEICAREKDSEYASVAAKTDGFESIIDASGDRDDDNVYFVDYHSDGGKRRIYFQPTEKMIDAIYKFNPRCVHK